MTCRSHPHIATTAPIPTGGPAAHPDVTAAVRDLQQEKDRRQAWFAQHRDLADPDADPDAVPDSDWADRAWQRSRDEATAARAGQVARAADAARAAEQARRDAERIAWLDDHPPF